MGMESIECRAYGVYKRGGMEYYHFVIYAIPKKAYDLETASSHLL